MPEGIGYGRRRKVPAGSPRMKSAQDRAEKARAGKGEVAEEMKRRRKLRGMFAPFAGLPPFQR